MRTIDIDAIVQNTRHINDVIICDGVESIRATYKDGSQRTFVLNYVKRRGTIVTDDSEFQEIVELTGDIQTAIDNTIIHDEQKL